MSYQKQPLDRRMPLFKRTKDKIERLDPRLKCDRTPTGEYRISVRGPVEMLCEYAMTTDDAIRVAHQLLERIRRQ